MKARRFFRLWGPVLLQTALLFYLSSQRLLVIHTRHLDKVVHFIAYGILALLCLRALLGGFAPLKTGAALLAVALATAYGATDEFHQSFVPGRDASGYDLLADGLGASFAVGIASLVLGWRRRGDGGSSPTAAGRHSGSGSLPGVPSTLSNRKPA